MYYPCQFGMAEFTRTRGKGIVNMITEFCHPKTKLAYSLLYKELGIYSIFQGDENSKQYSIEIFF